MRMNRQGDTMNATTLHTQDDDEMPAEIDFTNSVRAKFYQAGARINLPVYLDADVQAYLAVIASRKGVPLSDLANDLLKREIGIIEAVK